MSDKTGIQWTDSTWNCITGCTKVSAGCDHCYAETLALRLQKMGSPKYANGFAVTLHERALTIPLKWREPRRVFVNSMSDLFHVDVPSAFVDRVFAIMALTPQHTYQVLTKRPQRAANYLRSGLRRPEITRIVEQDMGLRQRIDWLPWPLPNVWLGTSVEDNCVRHRINALVQAPAAVHFLSCEPLIGPLDLDGYLPDIEWVIVGGESGPNYRALDPDWARDIRDQCQTWGVPFFFKQIGGLTPKSGGRLLDGREWNEFPTVKTPDAVAV